MVLKFEKSDLDGRRFRVLKVSVLLAGLLSEYEDELPRIKAPAEIDVVLIEMVLKYLKNGCWRQWAEVNRESKNIAFVESHSSCINSFFHFLNVFLIISDGQVLTMVLGLLM